MLLLSCKPKSKPVNPSVLKMELMDTDRAFSKMSEKRGMKAAFIEFIDSNGVLLRPHTLPIVGGDAVFYITQGNDTSYTMTWEPSGGNVASSGDLGYTYGVYSVKPHNADKVLYGTYVSIWRRQKDGRWKFVLDTGNEGIGEEEGEDVTE